MTFYGIQRKSDEKGENRVVAVACWMSSTARPLAGAIEYVSLTELAAAIEEACREDVS